MANPLVNDEDSKRITDAAINGIGDITKKLKDSIDSITDKVRLEITEAGRAWIRKHGRG